MLVAIAGCTAMNGYPKKCGDVKAELKNLEQYYLPDKLDEYNKLVGEDARKALRDNVVNGRLHAIDLQFTEFEQAVAGEHVKADLASDVAIIAVSATGTALAGYGVAQTVLLAVNSVISGTRAAVNEKVYFKKTIAVLFAKMESLRKVVLVRIRTGLTQPDSKYSLHEALIDLDDYYKAGSIPGALMGILEEAGASADEADKELKEIARYDYAPDENTPKIECYLSSGSGTENERINEVRKLIDEYAGKDRDGNPYAITDVISCGKFKFVRSKIVKKLNLK
jgi:hypothetical protein